MSVYVYIYIYENNCVYKMMIYLDWDKNEFR